MIVQTEYDGMFCQEIPWDYALKLWSEIEPFVIQALEYDLYGSTSTEKIKKQVSTGFARVLVCTATTDDAILSATIVQLHQNVKQERVLHVVTTAGTNSTAWLPALVEAWKLIAAEQSCDAITLAGRPGWARKMKQFGFKTEQIVMRMNDDGWIQQEQVKLEAVR